MFDVGDLMLFCSLSANGIGAQGMAGLHSAVVSSTTVTRLEYAASLSAIGISADDVCSVSWNDALSADAVASLDARIVG